MAPGKSFVKKKKRRFNIPHTPDSVDFKRKSETSKTT